MAQLSEHFSEKELGVDAAPDYIKENARFLCQRILEPVRKQYNAAVCVHDGFRCESHNNAAGGKEHSFHLAGTEDPANASEHGRMAADFHVEGFGIAQTFYWIRMLSGLPFDKVILETDKDGFPRCVHVQIDRLNLPRREAYVGQTGAATSYKRVEVGL